ncbi:MAG: helix-turn-helix domain-containing protein [Bryobacteraceae bacterium]
MVEFFKLSYYVDVYRMMALLCAALGRSREALEAVERIKSRVLSDLLAQSSWKPIDNSAISSLADLASRREDWVHRYARRSEGWDDPEHRQMLETSIAIIDATEGLWKDPEMARKLIQIESDAGNVSFEDLRAILQAETGVLLAEYAIISGTALLFVLRPDVEEPAIIELDIRLDEAREFAAHNFGVFPSASYASSMAEQQFEIAPEILTTREAAQLLRCSKAHLCNLLNGTVARLPRLPCLRLGRRKLVRRETLLQWMQQIEGDHRQRW